MSRAGARIGLQLQGHGPRRGSILPLWRAAAVAPEAFTALRAGLEPAIPGSVSRCLIHWATGPSGGIDAQAILTANVRLRGLH